MKMCLIYNKKLKWTNIDYIYKYTRKSFGGRQTCIYNLNIHTRNPFVISQNHMIKQCWTYNPKQQWTNIDEKDLWGTTKSVALVTQELYPPCSGAFYDEAVLEIQYKTTMDEHVLKHRKDWYGQLTCICSLSYTGNLLITNFAGRTTKNNSGQTLTDTYLQLCHSENPSFMIISQEQTDDEGVLDYNIAIDHNHRLNVHKWWVTAIYDTYDKRTFCDEVVLDSLKQ